MPNRTQFSTDRGQVIITHGCKALQLSPEEATKMLQDMSKQIKEARKYVPGLADYFMNFCGQLKWFQDDVPKRFRTGEKTRRRVKKGKEDAPIPEDEAIAVAKIIYRNRDLLKDIQKGIKHLLDIDEYKAIIDSNTGECIDAYNDELPRILEALHRSDEILDDETKRVDFAPLPPEISIINLRRALHDLSREVGIAMEELEMLEEEEDLELENGVYDELNKADEKLEELLRMI